MMHFKQCIIFGFNLYLVPTIIGLISSNAYDPISDVALISAIQTLGPLFYYAENIGLPQAHA